MKTPSPQKYPSRLLWLCASLAGASSAFGDSFTLDPPSPTLGPLGTTAGSILLDIPGPPIGGPPSIGIPFAGLGMAPGDVVDAISDGMDPVTAIGHLHYFSVTRASTGAPGSGVFIESSVADTPPGLTPGHASDIFVAGPGVLPGTNILAPAGFGWTVGSTTGDEANAGLLNPAGPGVGDNVNAYDLASFAPGMPVYFSLAAGSPSLVTFGVTASDIFAVGGPFGPFPIVFIPASTLKLLSISDLDALALAVDLSGPVPVFGGPGTIEFSLTASTAPTFGLTGADILTLAPFAPFPVVAHSAASIGCSPRTTSMRSMWTRGSSPNLRASHSSPAACCSSAGVAESSRPFHEPDAQARRRSL